MAALVEVLKRAGLTVIIQPHLYSIGVGGFWSSAAGASSAPSWATQEIEILNGKAAVSINPSFWKETRPTETGKRSFEAGVAEGAMSFTNAFLGPCPFSETDPRRIIWGRVAQQAEKEHAVAMASALGRDPEDVATWVDTIAAKFDVLTKALLVLMHLFAPSDGRVEVFKSRLEPAINVMHKFGMQHAPAWLRDSGLGAELKLRLIQRAAYWKAIALSLAELPVAETSHEPTPRRVQGGSSDIAVADEALCEATTKTPEPIGTGNVEVPSQSPAEMASDVETSVSTHETAHHRDKSVVAARPAPQAHNVFRYNSQTNSWETRFADEQRTGLKNLKGMELVRRLLAKPGEPISATSLLGRNLGLDGLQTIEYVGDPVLDPTAITSVRRHLNEINDKIEIARDVGHSAILPELEAEKSRLLAELQKNLTRSGRSRRLGSGEDRDRKAASKLYTTALRYLTTEAPALAAHLKAFIRSGNDYVYQNDTPWAT
jgi:hypothetical protein